MYRDINYFKNGYQSRTNIVKDEEGDLVTDWHSFRARWRNHFFEFPSVQGFNDVRQTDIQQNH